jgi:RNA polymerase sigma factor (sigma-70 family)
MFISFTVREIVYQTMAPEQQQEHAFDPDLSALRTYASDGNPDTLATLIERYQPMVQSTCWQILGQRDQAQDAAQDTFVSLLLHARHVRSNLPAWLHRTAVNAALSLRRSEQARRLRERGATHPLPPTESGPGSDDVSELHHHLSQLDPADQDLLVRHHLQGHSQGTLAAHLGISQPLVSRRLDQARERLRARLGNYHQRSMALLPILIGWPSEIAVHCNPRSLAGCLPTASPGPIWLVPVLGLALAVSGWWLVSKLPVGTGDGLAQTVAPSTAQADPGPGQPAPAPTWETFLMRLEDGVPVFFGHAPLPSSTLADWSQAWDAERETRCLQVNGLPPRPIRLSLRLRYDGNHLPEFCNPIQSDPDLMPKGKWQVPRAAILWDPAAAPRPGRWLDLQADLRFGHDAEGRAEVEIRRWCDGREYVSSRHPGHPSQVMLLRLTSGTCLVSTPSCDLLPTLAPDTVSF